MEFVHTGYEPARTCAAIATPPGVGGIAVIRISGNNAFQVASKIFSGPIDQYKSHTAHYGFITTFDGEKVDDVLVLVMRGKRSFTGEDTVEIHCHGGNLIPKRILQLTFDAGASPALAGEFSFKAFINGKIDLAQAEAIQAKIAANNALSLSCAEEQMEGRLSKKVQDFQKRLTHIAAIFEAWVDFPEEGLEFASFDEVQANLQEVQVEIEALIDSYKTGKIISQGVRAALVGSPNVGKSSLLNALLDKDRAIVSPIAGTTRDIVEDDLHVQGLHLRLIDTAGIHETVEAIESEGIRRSKQAIERSDVILYVLDATNPRQHDPYFETLPMEKTLGIWNKVDLEHERPFPQFACAQTVEISAKSGFGLDALYKAIDSLIWKDSEQRSQELVLTNFRHKEALQKAHDAIDRVRKGLETKLSCEFIAFDMRQALVALGTIIGSDITDEILTQVFSSFCIGK